MTTKTSIRFAAGMAAVVACGGLTLPACASRAETASTSTPAPIAVSAAPVRMTDVVDTFEAGGVVEARTTATITARIVAPVSEVRVAPGDAVRRGQVLLVLDGRDLDAHAQSANLSASAADQA